MAPPTHPIRLSPGSLALVFAVAALGLYLSFPTADYSFDAVGSAVYIERSLLVSPTRDMWHEFRILYMPAAYLVTLGARSLGVETDALSLMQILNALASAAALWVFWRLLYAELRSTGLTSVATALLALSYAWWFYATDPEVYPLCILFLLLTLRSALRLGRGGGRRDAALAGLFSGLAVGMHASALLMLGVVLLALVLRRPLSPRLTALYLAVALLVAALPYHYSYWRYRDGSLSEAVKETKDAFLHRESAEGKRWLLSSGYHPLQQYRGLERGLVAQGAEESSIASVSRLLGRVLLAAIYVFILLRLRALWGRFRLPALLSLCWLVVSFLFFTAYNVGSRKFVPFQLVPTLLLLGLALATLKLPARLGRLWLVLLALVPLALGLVNLAAAIYPDSLPENNPDLQKSQFIKEHTRPGDLVIHYGMGDNIKQKVYLPYFAWREELILDFVFSPQGSDPLQKLARVDQSIRQKQGEGHRVFLLSDVMENDALSALFHTRHGLPADLLRRYFLSLEPRVHAELAADFRLLGLGEERATNQGPR